MKSLYFLNLIIVILFYNCKKTTTNKNNNALKNPTITYAKGFDIVNENGKKKLIIKKAYQKSNEVSEYIITKTNEQNALQVPVKNIVVTSTTHIPMVELLNEENSIVGFPYAKYISSEKTRKLIDNGNIKEIGKEGSLNTEILLELNPDLIVGYSVSSADNSLTTLKNSGIPIIYNSDWLEETPLGRAEWIKFFGVLFDKEKEADSIFKSIEKSYLDAKIVAKSTKKYPTVLSGAIMSKGIWNLPAGESFVAQFLKDANVNYLWENTEGKGSLSLSFESVFNKGINADFWIAPGYFTSKEQMLNSNKLYKDFKAFKNNTIYSPSLKTGKTGGVLYYELAPTRPDLVLQDIIKITKPNLLPNYNLTFFEQMN